ncbi:DNA-packaging protein [Zavarzinella formosa]|uniref:DNA-packaging protein n=1 Tax=Zavarzinella formosa TaxID=360055 RepID=UPI0003690030|nr:terminase family protein [Zavarzinella formosa]
MTESPSTSELRERYLRALRAEQHRRLTEAAKFDWPKHARPNQIAPPEPWVYWLILAGRGFGKTRTGAEQVRIWVRDYPYVNLIGATSDDARDIMIEGESGILAICPRDERPKYLSQKRQLQWPNGAKSLIFTADEPERLRGKQHMKLWADEFCAWRYPDAWDQASLGLRLGDNPQAIITTTPKPTKALKELIADSGTVVTKGSTYENQKNLAAAFLSKVVTKYEGTRLGRQELSAEILDDNPGALWQRNRIDELRVKEAPPMKRIVVAIDPAATKNANSDETGIVVAGLGIDGHGYVLADLSLRGTPEEWGRAAVYGYLLHKADRIIGETNNGGEMVEHVIRTVEAKAPFKAVHASRGKITRAEPISSLYEQGKCHHVGSFPALEDQMCEYDPKTAKYSPDRMDALVWAFTELFNGAGEIRIRSF